MRNALPLTGETVIFTGTPKAKEAAELVKEYGGTPISIPLIEVEEMKPLPLRFAFDVLVAERFVLAFDLRKMLFSDLQFGDIGNDGLDRNRIESLVRKK